MPWPIKNPVQPGDGDPRHGTMNGYINHGCRCDLCRAANTEYCRVRRIERDLAPNDPRHGRWTTYFNYACRCVRCKAAHNEYEHQRYLARQAAS
jgi:hypothetical protein